jgi:hypothetical protein
VHVLSLACLGQWVKIINLDRACHVFVATWQAA